ncbi:MAG: di-trans,poly-cis-decaprenylcistransferase [Ruminococcus sp.]|nr:di-trans,poly-cis-decaprenylcistransferase [Ruminococcus sp.]
MKKDTATDRGAVKGGDSSADKGSSAADKGKPENLPLHVSFIMDGNGRWAKKRGLSRNIGHKKGGDTFREIARYAKDCGVKYTTFFAFSTENWKRPKEEVDALMKLFSEYLDEAENYAKDKTRLIFLGDKSVFPREMAVKMTELEKKSKQFGEFTLSLAVNYGGKDDIIQAAKRAASLCRDRDITPSDIDESFFSGLLYTSAVPDVDLLIRPGGERRLSNFLLWQCAYAELYFTDKLWPDYGKADFDKALDYYKGRNRRFGNV